jgi:Asp-tRNA(Asn)/Glu-tRNA(Gln) amidotransferase A subunit family amidase
MTVESAAGPLGQAILDGELSSEQAVRICLERIEKHGPMTRSFVSVRADAALSEARARDAGPVAGSLHGVPFAVKDIFDTEQLPTEFNSPLYRGHQPARDAAVVTLLRAAGGVFLGKVSTVEFASVGALPDTRNPHHPEFTPGGSSAGSGAAVGGGEVPGRVPVEGMKPFAPSLDTVGFIADGCALLHRAANACGIQTANAQTSGEAVRLRVGFYRTPYFDEAESSTVQALEAAVRLLERGGHRVDDVSGPEGAERLNEWQNTLMHGEGRASYVAEYARDPAGLHPGVLDVVHNRLGISFDDMCEAYDRIAALRPRFDAAMAGFDAWLTPAVPGEPPRIEEGNGLATFNRLFTALYLPCVALPGFRGSRGLPVGVQLVAPRFADGQLLSTASVLEALIRESRS